MPTRRQRDVLEAYLVTGSVKTAAPLVGLTPDAAAAALRRMRRRTGWTTAQAIYFGAREGWLKHPNSY